MHRQFGHPSFTVLVQILRLPSTFRNADIFDVMPVKTTKPKHQSTKVALPKDNVFGGNLGIDVLEIKDVADEPYLCLNILDLPFHRKPIRTISGVLELISRFEFEFCRRENFFEGFEFVVCSCECAVACLCPRNSISNVVASVTIRDDMYKYMYIYFVEGHKHIHVRIHVHIQPNTHTRLHLHTHTHLHIHIKLICLSVLRMSK